MKRRNCKHQGFTIRKAKRTIIVEIIDQLVKEMTEVEE